MWFGSEFDIAVQKSIAAQREWIDAQPNLLAHGRAVWVFEAHERPLDDTLELLRRFRRLYLYLAPEAVPTLMEEIAAAGPKVMLSLALKGTEDHLRTCAELAVPVDQKLPGAELIFADEDLSDELVTAVQSFHAAIGLAPQPASFVRGYDGTAVTSITLDPSGRVIGTSTVHHFRRADPRIGHVGYSCSTAIHSEFRGKGMARWQNSMTVTEARRRFGIKEVWSNTVPTNTAALAYQRSLHRRVDPKIGHFYSEFPL